MNYSDSYNVISSYLPSKLRVHVDSVEQREKEQTNEIRIRIGRPISYVFCNKVKFLCKGGTLRSSASSNDLVCAEKSDIECIVASLCRYSVHSCTRELTEAYFSIEKGVRVGIAGTYSAACNGVIKDVNALNFRISRQAQGCAQELYTRIFSLSPKSILLCGGVNSGKTTVLRDLCRLCGEKYKVALVDERNELAAISSGIPTNEIGLQTDIIEGCERSDAIISAVRTLSPDIIICDEISTESDTKAILNGFGSGVKFAATIHAESIEDLFCRSSSKELLKKEVFDYAVMLEGSNRPGRIREIRSLRVYD